MSWTLAAAGLASASATNSSAFAYNAANQRISQTASDNSWLSYPAATPGTTGYTANNLDQYTAVGAITPTYDANGNLTSDGSFTLGYDAESRLVSASGGGMTASYAFDAQGRRKQKTVNGVKTVFVTDADDRVVLDYDGTTGQVQRWYAYGLGPNDVLGQNNVVAATRTTLIPDVQGSYFASLDSGSGLLSKAAFQPFGQSATTTGTYRYTGARIDPETNGLYHMRARAYSPTLGRFLQADPIRARGGYNFYAYVNNDPLVNFDPSGLVLESARAGVSSYLSNSWEALSRAPAGIADMGRDLVSSPLEFLRRSEPVIAGIAPPLVEFGALSAAARGAAVAETGGEIATTTVGRWMSQAEFNTMSATERVVEGAGGRTYVTNPANPASYTSARPGSVYAEFNVPIDALRAASKPEWSVIPGPNVTTGIYGPAPAQMPQATCIACVIGGR